ncbi:endonuclease/exonuclease/phosphatase family protein [Cellulomonas hominis]
MTSLPTDARPSSVTPGPPGPPDAGTPTRLSLVALVTVLVVECIRLSGPLLDRAFTTGVVTAAMTAVGTYAAAGLVAAVLLLGTGSRGTGTPSGRTTLAGVALLVVVRVLVQATSDGSRYVVGLVTVAVAVAVLTLVVALVAGRPSGGRQAAVGLTLGIGLSVGLQLVLGSWDAVWRPGTSGWVVTVLLVAGTLAIAVVARGERSAGRPRRTWALGPALALVVMVVANPAFVAAQSGVALDLAGGVLVVGSTLGVWVLLSPRWLVPGVRVAGAAVLPVLVVAAVLLPDAGALVAAGLLPVATAVVLAGTLSARRPAPRGVPRTALATAAVGVGLVLVLLGYLVDYDVPLGFDNAYVPIAAALLVALSGLRWRTPLAPGTVDPTPAGTEPVSPLRANASRLLVIPAVLLALVGWWGHRADADVPDRSAADALVVVDWNLHYGVSPDTAVDLEQVARTIEAQDPDVVTLQEVARGWVLGGGADMATWLGRRLDMQVTFAPAADRQFGNAVLSRSALTDIEVHELPYGAGPQQRSALSATVTTADGTPVQVTSVHLQHREENTPTRLDQLAVLLAALPDDGPAVLAGDLNAEPGWPEIAAVTDAAWVSAVDAAGDPTALTSPSVGPEQRIDWLFTRHATAVTAEVLTAPRSSDHLPVVVTVRPTP